MTDITKDRGFIIYLESTLPDYLDEISRGHRAELSVSLISKYIDNPNKYEHRINVTYWDPDIPDGNMMPKYKGIGFAEPYYEEYIKSKRNKKLEDILSIG